MTLEELMKFAAKQAAGIFSIQECLHPMVHAIDDKGENIIISVPGMGGTDEEKDDAARQLREFFAANKVKSFVLMMEAWMLNLKELPQSSPVPRPSTSPDRIEIVALTAADATGEMQGYMPIIRPESGKPSLGKLETYRPTQAEGRFVGLLPTETREQ